MPEETPSEVYDSLDDSVSTQSITSRLLVSSWTVRIKPFPGWGPNEDVKGQSPKPEWGKRTKYDTWSRG
ncbi:uncharacterized protein GLRG_01039 [Colletotrichum graminicola M1.001]|uniref:Uncharacterized protein n=1 Tax=Colletotrichum graminicola (strain M1.001 / M2 / FGSC 10212) TaxID=645133 RepID=E3Q5C8_COLGM|nr:uncharacterized protein GLRG_01039 [Colletotrichum graminicola M1.001]EFQ25895.1 hypothetical protein GLRG_01039 [Colletotrichum graminicola M1.001]